MLGRSSRVKRVTVPASGGIAVGGFQASGLIKVRNQGAGEARMYLTQADFDAANDNHIVIPVAAPETPYGEWEGTLTLTLDKAKGYQLWFGADADTELEVVFSS